MNNFAIRISLFFVFSFLTIGAYSQGLSWCPPGASWKYEYTSAQGEKGYISIDYTHDTIIDGKTCQVLSRRRYFVPAGGSPLQVKNLGITLTHYEDKVVYVWDDYNEDFDTLFFFSTHAGDRYPVAIAPVFSQSLLIRADVQGRLILKTPENESIGAAEVQYDVKPETGTIVSRIDTLADGIGIVSGYFFPVSLYLEQAGHSEGGRFRCYSAGGKIVYQRPGAPACDYINGLEHFKGKESIVVWPQPVSDRFYLKGVDSNLCQSANLTDLTGNVLSVCEIKNGEGRLPAGLSKGLYLLQIQDRSGHKLILKLLVQGSF
jgi:hypothetical protein